MPRTLFVIQIVGTVLVSSLSLNHCLEIDATGRNTVASLATSAGSGWTGRRPTGRREPTDSAPVTQRLQRRSSEKLCSDPTVARLPP
jgi:hypothetical protein